ncbi:hypothetical protein AB6A40_004802 [Gnathostoma spinigerum]|uniref:Supervillin n=1 Tax=Gnathostoma spinigerum TaxID=75299 RepID=A0ABD6EDR4_9BILA
MDTAGIDNVDEEEESRIAPPKSVVHDKVIEEMSEKLNIEPVKRSAMDDDEKIPESDQGSNYMMQPETVVAAARITEPPTKPKRETEPEQRFVSSYRTVENAELTESAKITVSETEETHIENRIEQPKSVAKNDEINDKGDTIESEIIHSPGVHNLKSIFEGGDPTKVMPNEYNRHPSAYSQRKSETVHSTAVAEKVNASVTETDERKSERPQQVQSQKTWIEVSEKAEGKKFEVNANEKAEQHVESNQQPQKAPRFSRGELKSQFIPDGLSASEDRNNKCSADQWSLHEGRDSVTIETASATQMSSHQTVIKTQPSTNIVSQTSEQRNQGFSSSRSGKDVNPHTSPTSAKQVVIKTKQTPAKLSLQPLTIAIEEPTTSEEQQERLAGTESTKFRSLWSADVPPLSPTSPPDTGQFWKLTKYERKTDSQTIPPSTTPVKVVPQVKQRQSVMVTAVQQSSSQQMHGSSNEISVKTTRSLRSRTPEYSVGVFPEVRPFELEQLEEYTESEMVSNIINSINAKTQPRSGSKSGMRNSRHIATSVRPTTGTTTTTTTTRDISQLYDNYQSQQQEVLLENDTSAFHSVWSSDVRGQSLLSEPMRSHQTFVETSKLSNETSRSSLEADNSRQSINQMKLTTELQKEMKSADADERRLIGGLRGVESGVFRSLWSPEIFEQIPSPELAKLQQPVVVKEPTRNLHEPKPRRSNDSVQQHRSLSLSESQQSEEYIESGTVSNLIKELDVKAKSEQRRKLAILAALRFPRKAKMTHLTGTKRISKSLRHGGERPLVARSKGAGAFRSLWSANLPNQPPSPEIRKLYQTFLKENSTTGAKEGVFLEQVPSSELTNLQQVATTKQSANHRAFKAPFSLNSLAKARRSSLASTGSSRIQRTTESANSAAFSTVANSLDKKGGSSTRYVNVRTRMRRTSESTSTGGRSIAQRVRGISESSMQQEKIADREDSDTFYPVWPTNFPNQVSSSQLKQVKQPITVKQSNQTFVGSNVAPRHRESKIDMQRRDYREIVDGSAFSGVVRPLRSRDPIIERSSGRAKVDRSFEGSRMEVTNKSNVLSYGAKLSEAKQQTNDLQRPAKLVTDVLHTASTYDNTYNVQRSTPSSSAMRTTSPAPSMSSFYKRFGSPNYVSPARLADELGNTQAEHSSSEMKQSSRIQSSTVHMDKESISRLGTKNHFDESSTEIRRTVMNTSTRRPAPAPMRDEGLPYEAIGTESVLQRMQTFEELSKPKKPPPIRRAKTAEQEFKEIHELINRHDRPPEVPKAQTVKRSKSKNVEDEEIQIDMLPVSERMKFFQAH